MLLRWREGLSMADSTMCMGRDCPLRDDCFRYRATPEPENQTYFMSPPFKDGACEMFWSMGGPVDDSAP